MKIKTILFITILIFGVVFFINLSLNDKGEEFNPLKMNVGDVFEGVSYQNQMYIINYAIADVTGDSEKDIIILVGEKDSQDGINAKNMDVVVYDDVTNQFYKTGIKNFKGQNPKIFLNDFTGDDVNDILVLVDNENNCKNMRIVAMKNENLKEIFTSKDNKGVIFEGEIIDGVKAYLKCRNIRKELYIDLSDKKDEYIKLNKIDESGKVICEDKKIKTSEFIMVDIVELENQSGIQTTQIITAFDTNEIIDEIRSVFKYENGKWKLKDITSAKSGNLTL